MAAWRYEISSHVQNISALKEKFHVSAQPCNILYMLFVFITIFICILEMLCLLFQGCQNSDTLFFRYRKIPKTSPSMYKPLQI